MKMLEKVQWVAMAIVAIAAGFALAYATNFHFKVAAALSGLAQAEPNLALSAAVAKHSPDLVGHLGERGVSEVRGKVIGADLMRITFEYSRPEAHSEDIVVVPQYSSCTDTPEHFNACGNPVADFSLDLSPVPGAMTRLVASSAANPRAVSVDDVADMIETTVSYAGWELAKNKAAKKEAAATAAMNEASWQIPASAAGKASSKSPVDSVGGH